MNPAKLDRMISLQKRIQTRNAIGEAVASWVSIADVWAERIDSNGSQVLSALANRTTISTAFRIRYRSNLSPTDLRVVSGAQTFRVTHIAEEGRRTTLALYCEDITNG